MLSSIRAQGTQRLYVERMALLEQLLQDLGHRHEPPRAQRRRCAKLLQTLACHCSRVNTDGGTNACAIRFGASARSRSTLGNPRSSAVKRFSIGVVSLESPGSNRICTT
jgi:hypothetical protein